MPIREFMEVDCSNSKRFRAMQAKMPPAIRLQPSRNKFGLEDRNISAEVRNIIQQNIENSNLKRTYTYSKHHEDPEYMSRVYPRVLDKLKKIATLNRRQVFNLLTVDPYAIRYIKSKHLDLISLESYAVSINPLVISDGNFISIQTLADALLKSRHPKLLALLDSLHLTGHHIKIICNKSPDLVSRINDKLFTLTNIEQILYGNGVACSQLDNRIIDIVIAEQLLINFLAEDLVLTKKIIKKLPGLISDIEIAQYLFFYDNNLFYSIPLEFRTRQMYTIISSKNIDVYDDVLDVDHQVDMIIQNPNILQKMDVGLPVLQKVLQQKPEYYPLIKKCCQNIDRETLYAIAIHNPAILDWKNYKHLLDEDLLLDVIRIVPEMITTFRALKIDVSTRVINEAAKVMQEQEYPESIIKLFCPIITTSIDTKKSLA